MTGRGRTTVRAVERTLRSPEDSARHAAYKAGSGRHRDQPRSRSPCPGVAPAAARERVARPYVVVMAGEPISAYDGGVRGLRRHAGDARRRSRSLECRCRPLRIVSANPPRRSLRLIGARPAAKLHDYGFALEWLRGAAHPVAGGGGSHPEGRGAGDARPDATAGDGQQPPLPAPDRRLAAHTRAAMTGEGVGDRSHRQRASGRSIRRSPTTAAIRRRATRRQSRASSATRPTTRTTRHSPATTS